MLWGSAKAAYRLHSGLQRIGVESTMIVQHKLSNDPSVILAGDKLGKIFALAQPFVDRIPLWKNRLKRGTEPFTCGFSPGLLGKAIRKICPDIVHLHWVGNGFLRIESLRNIHLPVIWTLHDSWPFTGGCHLPGDCNRYVEKCGDCPRLNSQKQNDVTRWVWKRKKRSFRNISVVTPSKWLGACAQKSSLFSDFPQCVIPNGIDTQIYHPIDKRVARDILKLPENRKLVLFGAFAAFEDKNKGFGHLIHALEVLKKNKQSDEIELILFGTRKSPNFPELPVPYRCLGTYYDEMSLALVYSSADVFVIPSEQENFPNTILEAAACGTPSVAFSVGGIPEIIKDRQNGYLARPFDCHELAEGIHWIIEDPSRQSVLSGNARKNAVSHCTLKDMSQKYLQLYANVMNSKL